MFCKQRTTEVKEPLWFQSTIYFMKVKGCWAATLKVLAFEQQGISPIINSLANYQPLNWKIYNDVHII